jgi:hypothetical protein
MIAVKIPSSSFCEKTRDVIILSFQQSHNRLFFFSLLFLSVSGRANKILLINAEKRPAGIRIQLTDPAATRVASSRYGNFHIPPPRRDSVLSVMKSAAILLLHSVILNAPFVVVHPPA